MNLNVWEVAVRASCFLLAVAFIVRYMFYGWFRTQYGIQIMVLIVIIASFMGLVMISIIFGTHGWYRSAANVLFALMAILLFNQSRLLHKANSKKERRDNPENQTTSLADLEWNRDK